jgi:hypothetical protein
MCVDSKLAVLSAGLMLLATCLQPAFAGAKHKAYRTYYYPQPLATEEYAPPLRRIVGGDYVDRKGWRYRPGFGWDNTCFHLDYLASQFACNGGKP